MWSACFAQEAHGGFCIIPGSHKSCCKAEPLRILCSQGIERGVRADPLPHSIRTANVRTPIRHLEMGPGDLLFFLGGTVAHGAYRWESPEPRRQALFSYNQQRERPFTW